MNKELIKGHFCSKGHGILPLGSLVIKKYNQSYCLACAKQSGMITEEKYEECKKEEIKSKISEHQRCIEELEEELKKPVVKEMNYPDLIAKSWHEDADKKTKR